MSIVIQLAENVNPAEGVDRLPQGVCRYCIRWSTAMPGASPVSLLT